METSIQHAFIRQISLLQHLNRWPVCTWQHAAALTVLQTFCFSQHKLHRKRSDFHWLYTFITKTSVLHNSIPRKLLISSSWLAWFLHISLSNSAIMTEHVQLSYTHISRFAQTSLVSIWRALHFPAYCTCRAIHTTRTYPSHIFHYHTYLHATNSPHHLVASFLYIPVASLSHVNAVIYLSRDGLAPIRTDTSVVCAPQKRLSKGPALARNVSSYMSK
jgi:hypothetical protein